MKKSATKGESRRGIFSFLSRKGRKQNSLKFHKAPPLMKLLRKGDFVHICDCLEDDMTITKHWFEEEYGMMGEGCLHILMKYQPNPDVVTLMLKCIRAVDNSPPELAVDILGRTPLHHAVEFNCDPMIIEVLLSTQAGKCAVDVPDAEGRLPLHLAVLPIGEDTAREKDDRQDIRHTALKSTFDLLVQCNPQTVLICDYKGKSPIDYAKKHKSKILEVLLLSVEKSTQGSTSERRISHEGKTIIVPTISSDTCENSYSSFLSGTSDIEDNVVFHC